MIIDQFHRRKLLKKVILVKPRFETPTIVFLFILKMPGPKEESV